MITILFLLSSQAPHSANKRRAKIESIQLTLGEDTPIVREENKRATRIMLMILGRANI